MTRHLWAGAGVVLLSVIGGTAAGADLDWRGCVQESLTANPDLRAAREGIRQAEADRSKAGSGLLPQVSADAGASTSKKESSASTDSYSYGVTARQLIYDGGKTRSQAKQADWRVVQSREEYATVSAGVRQKLRGAFVQLLRAQEETGLSERILERRKQSTALIRLRYEAGREHRGSLLTAEAKEAQAQYDVSVARRELGVAQKNLLEALGRSADLGVGTNARVVRVTGSLEAERLRAYAAQAPDFGGLAGKASSVRKVAAQTEAAEHGVKAAKAGRGPQVQGTASAERSASDWPPEEDRWSLGVSVSLPLYQGGRTQAEISGAEAAWKQAAARERAERDRVAADLQSRWASLLDAVENVEVRRKFLDAARERAAISEAQYSSGLITFDNWIIIEDEFVQSEGRLLDAKAAAWIAESDWTYTRGGTLEDEQ